MSKRILTTMVLALALSACAPLYTTTRDWRAPAILGDYKVSATMNVGLLISDVTISVNGRQVLAGQSWFWSDNITMEGTVENLPIVALCNISGKTCDVTIAGFAGVKVNF
jgi:hypothetical protein